MFTVCLFYCLFICNISLCTYFIRTQVRWMKTNLVSSLFRYLFKIINIIIIVVQITLYRVSYFESLVVVEEKSVCNLSQKTGGKKIGTTH